MKTDQEKLWDAVGMLDGETVQTAMTRAAHMQAAHTTRRATLRRRAVILAAACLLLLIAGAFAAIPFMTADEPPPIDTPTPSDTAEQPTDTTPVTEDGTETTDTPRPFDWNIDTDRYTIQNIDGVCYMTFKAGFVATDSDKQNCQSMEIYFDSVKDMVDAFTKDTLTSAQMIVVQSAFPSTDRGYALWSTEALFDACTPDGIAVHSMALHGEYYDFFLMGEGILRGTVSYNTEKYIQWSKDLLYDWSEGATVTKQEISSLDGVPCEILEYKNSTETYRDIIIETEADGKKVDMVIRYLLEDERKHPERVSDTHPWSVLIYGEEHGNHYSITLDELTVTPTYEWLSSFGLTPYVPSAERDLPTE